METQELKEKIARNAASTWCRCFKCDKIIRDTNAKCNKYKLITCHQWYDCYRTALLALDDSRVLLYRGMHQGTSGADISNKRIRVMGYTIIHKDQKVFYSDWFFAESHWNDNILCVVDNFRGKVTFDGIDWKYVEYEHFK